MKNILNLLKKDKIKSIVLIILAIVTIWADIYALYALALLKGIETFIRILFSITIVLIGIILCLSYIKSLHKSRSKYFIFIPFVVIYCAILFVMGHYIIKTFKSIDKLTTTDTTYSSSLIALADNDSDDVASLGKGKIGMVDDDTNVIGYEIPMEIIKEESISNKIVAYSSYIDVLNALYDEEIEYAFVPTNYAVMFENMEELDFSTIRDDTKIIFTKDKTVENENVSSGTTLDKPFTILLMGVDSENESIEGSSFNGDSLILLTFNPSTLSSTILSIPRDSYVPIMCFAGNKKNKITHAAWYGEECMMDTIENFTGIPIDYFVKINFKGVVKLVDTLDGVEVDVPYAFCEQDSNRKFGNNTIYVEKGLQVLNGEQALAFARNRHTWPEYCGEHYSNYVSNDFIRGQNQQTVIRSLLNKMKGISSLDTVYALLDTIGTSMQTNMTTTEILSLYNIAKDILVKNSGQEMDDLLSIQRLYLSGYDKYIYDPGSGLNLYNFILYKGSIADVSNAMKINLELVEPTMIKEFTFSIDEPYEEVVIGKGNYTASSSDVDSTLPDFIGDSEAQARKAARQLGLSVSFEYKKVKDGNNTVISQNYKAGTSLSKVSNLVLTIGTPKTDIDDEEDKEIDEDNDDKKLDSDMVKVPYLTDMTVSEAIKECKKLGVTLVVRDKGYKQTDKVISQESVGKVEVGSTIYVRVKLSATTTPDKEDTKVPDDSKNDTDSDVGTNNSPTTPEIPKEDVVTPDSNTTVDDNSSSSNNSGATVEEPSLEIDDKIKED